MDTPSAPAAPDPAATASAQGQMNKDTAIAQAMLNMVDSYSPYGSVTYSQIPGTGTQSSGVSTGGYTDPTTGYSYTSGSAPAGYNSAAAQSVPRYQQTVTLSPEQQKIYDTQTGIQQSALNLGQNAISNVQNAISQPFSLSGLPSQVTNVSGGKIQTSVPGVNYQTTFGDAGDIQRSIAGSGDYANNVQSVQDALMSRLNPSIEQDRTRLETQLANQGVFAGTPAYDRAMNLLEQNVNDQRTQALLAASQEQTRLANLDYQAGTFANSAQQQAYNQALGRGTFSNDALAQQFATNLASGEFANNAQNQSFNQALTNANLQNAGRQQGIQEAAYLRSQPINELASLMGFSPGVTTPTFANTGQTGVATPDYQGAVSQAYQGALNNYNQQLAANNSTLGSIFGLGGQLGSAWITSDRRAKTNIRRIGTANNGLPIYLFRYKGSEQFHVGFMADDVEKIKPWAVIDNGSYKMVNYELAAAA